MSAVPPVLSLAEREQPMSPRQITVLGECVADAFTEPGKRLERTRPAGAAWRRTREHGRGPGPARHAGPLPRHACPAMCSAACSGPTWRRPASTCRTPSPPPSPARWPWRNWTATGQAAFSFHAQNTADWQWTAEELARVDLSDTACVHTGSLALVREPGGGGGGGVPGSGALHGATISIDPNVRPLLVRPEVYRARLAHWCALADILRLSEDDLELLLPGTPPEQACDIWHAAGARLVVITLGADGALASLDGERLRVPAVADAGRRHGRRRGLLHRRPAAPPRRPRTPRRPTGRSRSRRRRGSLPFGARVAALTCSVAGPNPPWQNQLARLTTAGGA